MVKAKRATIMMTTWVDSRCRTGRQRGTRIYFPSHGDRKFPQCNNCGNQAGSHAAMSRMRKTVRTSLPGNAWSVARRNGPVPNELKERKEHRTFYSED